MQIKCLWARLFLVVCVSCLLAGCTVNINLGDSSGSAAENEKTTIGDIFGNWNKKAMYESHMSIYIGNTTADDRVSISAADVIVSQELVDTYQIILQSDLIQNQIHEKYPAVEYKMTLESMGATELFTITVIGEAPEHLEDICNMAASLLCEKVPAVIENAECRIVDYATSAYKVGMN